MVVNHYTTTVGLTAWISSDSEHQEDGATAVCNVAAFIAQHAQTKQQKTNSVALSPQAYYTD
jgi:hypothetical protein